MTYPHKPNRVRTDTLLKKLIQLFSDYYEREIVSDHKWYNWVEHSVKRKTRDAWLKFVPGKFYDHYEGALFLLAHRTRKNTLQFDPVLETTIIERKSSTSSYQAFFQHPVLQVLWWADLSHTIGYEFSKMHQANLINTVTKFHHVLRCELSGRSDRVIAALKRYFIKHQIQGIGGKDILSGD